MGVKKKELHYKEQGGVVVGEEATLTIFSDVA